MNRLAGFICLAALGCAGTYLPARANSIVVDSTGDSGGACTLRYAIDNANDNAQTHSECAAGGGADTITFDSTVFATPQTITVNSTLPKLTDSNTTTIDGANVVTVSGGQNVQVFIVGDFTTKVGSAVFRDIDITDGSGVYGGGMEMSGTTLELDHVTIANSSASYSGGGFYSQSGTTTIDGCIFDANTAPSGNGGAMDDNGAVVNISNSTFTGNSASGAGGAIFYAGASISAIDATVTITNSTFTDNTGNDGGAISNFRGMALTLDYVTVSGNTATDAINFGGAVYVDWNGTLSVSNSIIAANTRGDCYKGGHISLGTPPGSLTDAGYNWFGDKTCNGTADGDPKLGSLTDNGGLTLTMAPLGGSPVIDAANCEVGVPTDQRGVARPQGIGCDIGAVEVQTIFTDGFETPAM